MSGSKRRRMPDLEDPWQKHEAEIRKLYMARSVGEVKKFMEQERGFKAYSLKTWHEKLGDLGIRKNVTKEEWHMIWQHVQPYLEDPTRPRGDLKLKRTKGTINISVHGRVYNWDQAWKNMKSAGAVGQPYRDPISPLPPDILIETTPSLTSRASAVLRQVTPYQVGTIPRQQQLLSCSKDLIHPQRALACQQHMALVQSSLLPASNGPSNSSRCVDGVVAMPMGTIPILSMITKVLDITKISWGQMRALLGSQSDPKLLSFQSLPRRPIFDRSDSDVLLWFQSFDCSQSFLSAVLQRPHDVVLATPANNLQAYVFLSMAIYLFSNNLVDEWSLLTYRDRFFSKLDAVFKCIPRNNLQALLRSRLSSIRAAWEELLIVAGWCKQVDFFRVMIEVGLTNCWVAVHKMGHTYLSLAASMGLTDVIQRLLSEGCRPDDWPIVRDLPWTKYAILEALINGHRECARLLLESCDVNRPLRNDCSSNFEDFIEWYSSYEGKRSQNPVGIRGLQMFVEAGADLDAVFDFPLYLGPSSMGITWINPEQLMPPNESETYDTRSAYGWRPTVLDYLFSFHRSAFDRVAHYSHAFTSNVTRAGVLLALEEDSLEGYFSEKTQVSQQMRTNKINELLQAILVEQFIIIDYESTQFRQTNLKVVHALLKFGIKFAEAAVDYGRSTQVSYVLKLLVLKIQMQRQKWLAHETQALKLLIDHGAVVQSSTLGDAVHSHRTGLLEFLILHMDEDELPTKGRYALARAVSRNNIEAVEILLDAGVDINAEVSHGSQSMSILAYALYCKDLAERASETIRFLVGRGAILRFSKKMPSPTLLLHHLLKGHAPPRSAFRMVRYLVKQTSKYKFPLKLSASMLERCKASGTSIDLPSRRAIFKYLFRKGAPVRPGSPLAVWILLEGDTKFFRELLDAGADINCHTAQIFIPWHQYTPLQAAASICNDEAVLLLLRECADVNAPAKGERGRTALQAICSFNPRTQKEEARRTRIIQSLIDNGANINAAPARDGGGLTALQSAADTGHLETAILLLRYGADVNAPPGNGSGYKNALDLAAQSGRLDMVKLLLNADALSGIRGSTGYDGAIEAAEDKSHFAVAELIRQHAAEAESNGSRNPYLSQPPRR